MNSFFKSEINYIVNPEKRHKGLLFLVNHYGLNHRSLDEVLGVNGRQVHKYFRGTKELPAHREKLIYDVVRKAIVETKLAIAYIEISLKKDSLSLPTIDLLKAKLSLGVKVLEDFSGVSVNKDMELNTIWMQELVNMGLEPCMYSQGVEGIKNKTKLKKALQHKQEEADE